MKYLLCLLSLVVVSFIVSAAYADVVIFSKEYTYQASDFDSRNSSRTIALEMVKRLLLEELGTYLVSETEVRNMRLTKDQITTYSAGIVSAKVIDEKWDGKTFWLKAIVSADPKEVEKSLKKIVEDKFKSQELEETRKKAEELTRENERLSLELKAARQAEKHDIKAEAKNVTEYENTIRSLSAVDWFEKGNVLMSSETASMANIIAAYNMAIELNPEFTEAYRKRGWAYVKFNKIGQAIKDFEKIIELDPIVKTDFMYSDYDQKITRYSSNGGRLSSDSYWEEVIESIGLGSNDSSLFVCRGIIYETLEKWKQAIKNYNKAIELDSNYANTYRSRGRCYRNSGEYERAIKDYDKAIKLNPKMTEAFLERGIIYMNRSNYKQAIKDYDTAIRLNPKNAWIYLARGYSYQKLGEDNRAIEEYKTASQLGNKVSQHFLSKKGIEW